jgi:hypothetical protein
MATHTKPRSRTESQEEPPTAQAQAVDPHAALDGTTTVAVSAALARRLAETADGHRDGKEHWVVTSPTDPTTTKLRSFESRTDAEMYRDLENAAGGSFGVFGPYQTPRDPVTRQTGLKVSVKKVTVELEDEAGTKYTAVIEGDQYDALFWSRSSVDKFAVPYYVGVADVEFGMKVRDDFSVADVFMMAHMPDTTYATSFLQKKTPADPTTPSGVGENDPGKGLEFRLLTR